VWVERRGETVRLGSAQRGVTRRGCKSSALEVGPLGRSAVMDWRQRLAESIPLCDMLTMLRATGPAFLYEAIFWHLRGRLASRSRLQVRLEVRADGGTRESVEVMLSRPDLGTATFIGLKFVKAAWSGVVSGEQFHLPNTGAHDIVPYDVVKQITRLERFVDGRPGSNGLLLCVTKRPSHGGNRPTCTPSPRHSGSTMEARFTIPTNGTPGPASAPAGAGPRP
jgi:hypothetical protein